MLLSRVTPLLCLAAAAGSAAEAVDTGDSATPVHPPACTATSSTGSGAYFDLRPDIAAAPGKSKSSYGVTKDYHIRGYDYNKNFTLNICSPVIEPVKDVSGVSDSAWANVSAYYTSYGDVYSIGSGSMDLRSRGRKLVLQYTGGSPCGGKSSSKREPTGSMDDRSPDAKLDPHPQDLDTLRVADDSTTRRKSTIISFLCDHDPANTQASISFVGTDPDECAYFFEARSSHACAQAEPHKPGSVGPGSVFGLILVIAVLVYVLGGVFYNRTVAHARGWRQLPNYSLWAGIWSFISDIFIASISSCARFLPSRRGYSQIGAGSTRRDRNSEAENRLIDQLDEEWDD